MTLIKNPFGRYKIIDRLLSGNPYVKTKSMKQAVLYELEQKVSEKTINNDIIAMRDDKKLGYHAPIKYCHSNKAYYYSDSAYTIAQFKLKSDDIAAIRFYTKAISQYRDYDVFRNFSNAIDKILTAIEISGELAESAADKVRVQTENAPPAQGNQWIIPIVQALNSRVHIDFEYQKFEDEVPKMVVLQPLLLKEYRHLWYVLGINTKGYTSTYALDRIVDLKVKTTKYKPVEIDFTEYFKYSFGITVIDEPPTNVVLSFRPLQGKYLKALKLHETQETLIDNQHEFRISIVVTPTYEFYDRILGYGECVEVISPQKIRSEIKSRINMMKRIYSLSKK